VSPAAPAATRERNPASKVAQVITDGGAVTLTVAVLTYKRPRRLRAALDGVMSQVQEFGERPGVDANLLVIDNDPAASARAVAAEFDSPQLRYVVEPHAGISAARNRALHEVADRDLLVVIDDDEEPLPGWLESLVSTWRATGAAAVMGRVEFRRDLNPDPWIDAGGFFDRLRRPSGEEIPAAATGNLLLDLHQVRRYGVRFDERLGLTGGEDTLFTRQLVKAGGRIVFCDESIAVEDVPVDRLTRNWVLTRTRRVGITETLVAVYLAEHGVARLRARALGTLRGVTRLSAGLLRLTLGLLIRSQRHAAQGHRIIRRGQGMILGAVGVVHQEYARNQVDGRRDG